MAELKLLRAFIRDRLIEAAEEIFGAVARTVANYQEEVSATRGLQSRSQLLNVVTPTMENRPLELQQNCEQERSPSLEQGNPVPPVIKEEEEEQEELYIIQEKPFHGLQEDEDVKGSVLSSCVESEDNRIQTPCNATVFGDSVGTLEEQMQATIDEETLYCHVYEYDEGTNIIDQDHTSIPIEENPYNCSECSKEFNNPGLLQLHMRVHRKTHSCNVCTKRFSAKSLLKRHMRSHTGEKPFLCEFCPFSSSQKGHVIIHMRTHTGERPYKCTECGKGFTQSSSLRTHTRVHSELQQNCVQEQNLSLDHEDPEPTPIKEEQEELCIIQEKTFHGLEEDEDAKGSILITCVESGDDQEQTPSNTTIFGDCLHSLEEQAQTHIGKRTLRCLVYGDHIINKKDVKNRRTFPTDKNPYRCAECGKAFNNPGLLRRHMTIHLKTLSHCCAVCNRKCKSRSLLKRHMRTHTGERPFQCKICPFRSGQKGHLTIHMRTHTGERPYTCTACGKRFTQNSNLTTHMKTHYGKKNV